MRLIILSSGRVENNKADVTPSRPRRRPTSNLLPQYFWEKTNLKIKKANFSLSIRNNTRSMKSMTNLNIKNTYFSLRIRNKNRSMKSLHKIILFDFTQAFLVIVVVTKLDSAFNICFMHFCTAATTTTRTSKLIVNIEILNCLKATQIALQHKWV